MNAYFIHRDPILDRSKAVVGYELFFRTDGDAEQGAKWPAVPMDGTAIQVIATDVGFERLTGGKQAFLDIDTQIMETDLINVIPKKAVIQLTEKDVLDKSVLVGSTMLKKQDYGIALKSSQSGSTPPFNDVADFVKVDVSCLQSEDLPSVIAPFGKLPVTMVAVNVHDKQVFDKCQQLGFKLFQGSLFSRSDALPPESISSNQTLLMQLSRHLRENKDVSIIENAFKNSPKLTFGLLNLMNSAFFGVSNKVSSIRHAITLLGYENLQKWVVLLLFTVDNRDASSNPLIEKAVVRGRMMEFLAQEAGKRSSAESAFITGMLSFISILFNVSSEEVLKKLNLTQEIEQALMARAGFLGGLLSIAEKVDSQDYEGLSPNLESLNLTLEQVLSAETAAVMEGPPVFNGNQVT
jgi:c-di-GMP-related signal transduction protein